MRRTVRLVVALAMLSTTLSLGLASPASADGEGTVQVAGSTDAGSCTSPPAGFAAYDYAFHIGGDLEGCIYGVITGSGCHPSGTYQEVADEIFVSDSDAGDTFRMTELYTAKFEFGTPCDWATLLAPVFARCKHPIVAGSGTGSYEGVTGRLDFKDDVDTGVAAYKGHLGGF